MYGRRFLAPLVCATVLSLLGSLSGCMLLRHRKAKDAETTRTPGPGAGIVGKHSNGKGLSVEIKADPDPVRLGEAREIKVTFVVRNIGKNTATLKFPTSQTIEIDLRDVATGQVVSQWSTDRTFTPATRYLIVNAGERLEYNEPITTRELKVGRTYNLEAYFVGYAPELRASRPIIPQP